MSKMRPYVVDDQEVVHEDEDEYEDAELDDEQYQDEDEDEWDDAADAEQAGPANVQRAAPNTNFLNRFITGVERGNKRLIDQTASRAAQQALGAYSAAALRPRLHTAAKKGSAAAHKVALLAAEEQKLTLCTSMMKEVAAVFGYDADVQLAPEPEPSAAGTEEGAAAAAAGSRRRGLTVQLSEVVSARLGRGPASKAAAANSRIFSRLGLQTLRSAAAGVKAANGRLPRPASKQAAAAAAADDDNDAGTGSDAEQQGEQQQSEDQEQQAQGDSGGEGAADEGGAKPAAQSKQLTPTTAAAHQLLSSIVQPQQDRSLTASPAGAPGPSAATPEPTDEQGEQQEQQQGPTSGKKKRQKLTYVVPSKQQQQQQQQQAGSEDEEQPAAQASSTPQQRRRTLSSVVVVASGNGAASSAGQQQKSVPSRAAPKRAPLLVSMDGPMVPLPVQAPEPVDQGLMDEAGGGRGRKRVATNGLFGAIIQNIKRTKP